MRVSKYIYLSSTIQFEHNATYMNEITIFIMQKKMNAIATLKRWKCNSYTAKRPKSERNTIYMNEITTLIMQKNEWNCNSYSAWNSAKKCKISKQGFDPRPCGLWTHYSFAMPL